MVTKLEQRSWLKLKQAGAKQQKSYRGLEEACGTAERVLHNFGEYIEGLWKYELCRCAVSKVTAALPKLKFQPSYIHFISSQAYLLIRHSAFIRYRRHGVTSWKTWILSNAAGNLEAKDLHTGESTTLCCPIPTITDYSTAIFGHTSQCHKIRSSVTDAAKAASAHELLRHDPEEMWYLVGT